MWSSRSRARFVGLSRGVAYSHTRRLVNAGLMWRVPVNDGGGGVVAVTPRGAAHVRDRGIAAVTPRSQAPSSGVHARAVSWIAARAETSRWRWLGPADLAADRLWHLRRDDGARHRPDLGLIINGSNVAFEVELHAKAPTRLAAILAAYRWKLDYEDLHGVTYVVDKPHVERLVRSHMRKALLAQDAQVGLAAVVDHVRNPRPQGPRT